MRIARLPGVFRPRSDTWLLVAALRRRPELHGGAVLDVCTGSGAIAVAAALAGARSVTAAASATVACASGTRTSSVPNAGCGRSSHHQRRGSGTAPEAAPQASSSAKASHDAIAGGIPWRGSCSAIFGRIDASPVSRPPWNGALAASAATSGSHGRRPL